MTIDDIFAALPDEPAQDSHEFLVIDPTTRTIQVPANEIIFGVEGDEDGERKYFISPRYVGDNLDLAACFLSIVYRNANGEPDQYLVTDAAVNGEYVTFSWLISKKVVKYKGAVQFRFDADTAAGPAWGTTMAQGESLEGMEPDIDTVEEQTSDVVTQLRAMVAQQTGNVEAVGAAQVKAVNAEGSTQVAAVKATGADTEAAALAGIQAQGEATLATIPAEYTALTAQVDRLTRDRAAAIVCQAEGTAIQVQDASNDPLQGLRIFGKSTQDGTPSPAAPVEIVSAPAPVVTVCGKNLWDHENDAINMASMSGWGSPIWGTAAVVKTLRPKTTYTMRFTVTCLSVPDYETVFSDDCGFVLYSAKESGKFITLAMSRGEGALSVGEKRTAQCTFTTPENVQDASMGYEILRYVQRYKQADGTAVYATAKFEDVHLELGDTATAYEPYTGQILTITTPGSLPGIPVTSGGNYTDADGQRWVCDEVDLARGVYVQRVKEVTITAAPAFNETADQPGRFSWFCLTGEFKGGREVSLCNYAKWRSWGIGDGAADYGAASINQIYYSPVVAMTADEVNAKFAKMIEDGTPPTILGQLETPVVTPLTDVELQTFRALHSCKPVTTVLNDAGAWMALEYAADPKTYIDNKLAALAAANN